MSMSIRSKKVEQLARELARRTGETMTDAIADALEARLDELGASVERKKAELLAIAEACIAAPDVDTRSSDEILGYDEMGVFGRGGR